MKASELRIGNWVNNNGEDYQITSATIVSLERGESTAHPILITEEWLKRFGFEKLDDERGLYVNNKINLFIYFDGRRVSGYIHELQNFVYCLSGKELEI
jgi:hypothetical protein